MDIIQLLPDAVANQIAAGEVVQRPASAVKELLENAIDAGAATVKLIVKDAGKTLIQVIDNGSGMSETDARLCFARHATSKIRKVEDIFSIRTMGFRGEALASIAAIAQVELRTKRESDELGVLLQMEGSELVKQEMTASPKGTSIMVKNLFFNVPARRNFLKSDAVEWRHILDEFYRVALAHPDLAFALFHNDQQEYNLHPGNLRQRIVGLFGNIYNEKLVPVSEQTNVLKVEGFVGKPEAAKKSRGEQFFFVNQRFIRSPYLNSAVQKAYHQLIAQDQFPSYFLFLDIDPKAIDINIHPTKTEIKFEDDYTVYAILHSAVKRALGKHNITPSLDFEQEMSLKDIPLKPQDGIIRPPVIKVNPDYNPFKNESSLSAQHESNRKNWQQLYEPFNKEIPAVPAAFSEDNNKQLPLSESVASPGLSLKEESEESAKAVMQLQQRYIVTSIKSGMVIIDQQAAHERILYEYYLDVLQQHPAGSQQELFPQTLELSPVDYSLVKELWEHIHNLGFDIAESEKGSVIIRGIPADAQEQDSIQLLMGLLDNYKANNVDFKLEIKENLARSMARHSSIRSGKKLSHEEMNLLIDHLFACAMPSVSPTGKPVFVTLAMEEISRRFGRE
jgi:DNA mismatch repair protein MutL